MRRALVLKFGGSATTNQTGLNPSYLAEFFSALNMDLMEIFDKAVFVVGGGIRARKQLALSGPQAALTITRQHAAELAQALRGFNFPISLNVPVSVDQLQKLVEETKFGVAVGGLELGQTTDAVAMSAAQVLNDLGYMVSIVVLSNVPAIYTGDPRESLEAQQVAVATLEQLVELGVLIADQNAFIDGMNVPLDPVAVHRYTSLDHHSLFFAGAGDAVGVRNYLTQGELNSGTLIKHGSELCFRSRAIFQEMTSIQPLVILQSARYNLWVTVEQRVYSRDDEDSQRAEKPLVIEDEALSENGIKVKRSLFTIIERYIDTNPELVDLVVAEINTYPNQLFSQLGLVEESPVFKAQEGQKGHWIYELTMVDRTMACASKIKEYFGRDDKFIAELVFMIIVGDIGKAGPVPADQNSATRVVSRIYNQAIFHGAHQSWLKSCDPSTFPAELEPALARIDRHEPEAGGVSQWDFIFKNGAFIGLPVEVYLYILKQVALTKLNGNPDQVNTLFSLSEREREFLSEHGFNPTTTPIRKFFTASHIRFGLDFLNRDGFLNQEQKRLAILALTHHFSQAELPPGLDANELLEDEEQLKTCAYLEILDKVDAVFHRGSVVGGVQSDEEARQKAIDSAINIVHTEIQTNLSRNYPNQEKLKEVYSAVLVAMRDSGVFDFS